MPSRSFTFDTSIIRVGDRVSFFDNGGGVGVSSALLAVVGELSLQLQTLDTSLLQLDHLPFFVTSD